METQFSSTVFFCIFDLADRHLFLTDDSSFLNAKHLGEIVSYMNLHKSEARALAFAGYKILSVSEIVGK